MNKFLLCILVLFPSIVVADIYVHAAALLTDALTEIGDHYQKENHKKIFFNSLVIVCPKNSSLRISSAALKSIKGKIAKISTKVRIAFEVPAQHMPRISYPVSILKQSSDPAGARKFYEYLLSSESLNVFQKYGFTMK